MRSPWFSDRGIGTLFPLPVTLPGWLSLPAIALIAMSATLHRSWAWVARVAVALALWRSATTDPTSAE